ncbi:hypothetical protein ABT158_26195, partial [Nonomuraea sp. NPDC001636]|uniref:hypothetical protein n=1 Tax=Nonomuraea sp. NPDC001636 TaxID=3154391 RepID=UPI0033296C79
GRVVLHHHQGHLFPWTSRSSLRGVHVQGGRPWIGAAVLPLGVLDLQPRLDLASGKIDVRPAEAERLDGLDRGGHIYGAS